MELCHITEHLHPTAAIPPLRGTRLVCVRRENGTELVAVDTVKTEIGDTAVLSFGYRAGYTVEPPLPIDAAVIAVVAPRQEF